MTNTNSAQRLAFGALLAVGLGACGGSTDTGAGGSGGVGASSGGGAGGSTGGTGGSVGGNGGNGGSVGGSGGATTGCSLAVVAAGTLPDPVAPTASVTGPGVVATDSGFVIGYREQDGATLRAKTVFLDDGGKLGTPEAFDLNGCSNVVPTDGVGLAYEAGHGMFVSSLPNCGQGAGAVFIPFDKTGSPQQASGPKNGAFTDLTVARQGTVAPAAAANEFEFIYRVTSTNPPVIERAVLQGPGFKTTVPVVHPLGDGDLPFGMVASTPKIRAFLGADPTQGNVVGLVGPRTSDTIDTKGQFTLPLADWATMTAWDNRVAAAVPGGSGLNVTMAELTSAGVSGPMGLVGTDSALSGALARLGSHLFVAEGHAAGISLFRLESADATVSMTPEASVDFTLGSSAVPLVGFDGTHLAMAAARQRVALVWTTKGKLASGDATGGWALLDCAQ